MESLAKYLGRLNRILKNETNEGVWIQARIISIEDISDGNHVGMELVEVSEGKANLAYSSARIWETNRTFLFDKLQQITGEKFPIGAVLSFKVESVLNYRYGHLIVIRDCEKIKE